MGLGFVSYYIADIGLALVAIFAMLRANTDFAGMMSHIGRIPAVILSCATVLCIGPGIAIPRTAATTYEMGVMPIFGLEGKCCSNSNYKYCILCDYNSAFIE